MASQALVSSTFANVNSAKDVSFSSAFSPSSLRCNDAMPRFDFWVLIDYVFSCAIFVSRATGISGKCYETSALLNSTT